MANLLKELTGEEKKEEKKKCRLDTSRLNVTENKDQGLECVVQHDDVGGSKLRRNSATRFKAREVEEREDLGKMTGFILEAQKDGLDM